MVKIMRTTNRILLEAMLSMFLGGILAQVVLYPFGIFHPEVFFGILLGQCSGTWFALNYLVPRQVM
jgi:hypothetical protein